MAEDIRENQMLSGTPAKIRALDASGNSISPSLAVVAKALPKRNEFTIELEPESSYSLSGYTYNTLFVYESLMFGAGCLVLLGWHATIVYGDSIFSNTDNANSISIYNTAQAKAVIKNNKTKKVTLKINVV